MGLISLIATLRAEGRLPIATIQWYLATVHALSVSGGAIGGVIQQVARAGGGEDSGGDGGSLAAHLDETG